MKKKFKTILVQEKNSAACGVNLKFNPKDIFGKVRAPIIVQTNKHTFRTTTFSMGGSFWFPVKKKIEAKQISVVAMR